MNMKLTSLLAAAVLGTPSLSVAQSGAQADEVIAKFGGVEIRSAELRQLLTSQGPALASQIAGSPPALDRLVRTEAFKRALLAEARAKGWDKRPEVVEQMARARDEALVATYVNELARPPASFPDEKTLREAYEAGKAEFVRPREFRLAQIFIGVPAGGAKPDIDAAQKRAEDLSRRARAPGADFAALARTGSEHAESARQGGDMGWAPEPQMLPEVARVAGALKLGEVSEPVRSPSGWHVLRLVEARPQATRTFEEMREALAAALRERRARETEQKYYDDMLAKNPIAVNEVGLLRLRESLPAPRP